MSIRTAAAAASVAVCCLLMAVVLSSCTELRDDGALREIGAPAGIGAPGITGVPEGRNFFYTPSRFTKTKPASLKALPPELFLNTRYATVMPTGKPAGPFTAVLSGVGQQVLTVDTDRDGMLDDESPVPVIPNPRSRLTMTFDAGCAGLSAPLGLMVYLSRAKTSPDRLYMTNLLCLEEDFVLGGKAVTVRVYDRNCNWAFGDTGGPPYFSNGDYMEIIEKGEERGSLRPFMPSVFVGGNAYDLVFEEDGAVRAVPYSGKYGAIMLDAGSKKFSANLIGDRIFVMADGSNCTPGGVMKLPAGDYKTQYMTNYRTGADGAEWRIMARPRSAELLEKSRFAVLPGTCPRVGFPCSVVLSAVVKEASQGTLNITPVLTTAAGWSVTLYKAGRIHRDVKYTVTDAGGRELASGGFKPG